MDEYVVTRGEAVDVDVLALLDGDVDVAPADGDSLENAPRARLVLATVALVDRVRAAGAERREGRTVVAR